MVALRRLEMTSNPFDSEDDKLFDIVTRVPGPAGSIAITEEMLRNSPSGDLFGLSQNAGMGWDMSVRGAAEILILSTHGGIRAPDGRPIALGYHTGHWEVGLLMEAAAEEFKRFDAVPFAGFCTDPCDGRSQGTTAMFDSLPFRNDAAIVFRRLIRSLPTRNAVLGIATCDKGLPAMMMALAGTSDLPCVLVPGGVTLLPESGDDAGRVQTIGVRFSHGEISLEQAAELGCRACASPGGGCQFMGTAATSQVIGEALGMSVGHAALAPSGHPIWLDMARRSARALMSLVAQKAKLEDVLTSTAINNAMLVHAACGGSTNLLLHLPAIAHAAGLRRPTVEDWQRVNREVPRIVDALPNGPKNHATVQVFLAGGVPEVMLVLRKMGVLDVTAMTVSGTTLDQQLDAWEDSERRRTLRKLLQERDGIDPDDVIVPNPSNGSAFASTVCFPEGNLAPDGSVIKSTAIDPSMADGNGVYRIVGPAKVFFTEPAAIEAIKKGDIRPGDVLVLACRGPMGAGMEETSQLTSALRYLDFGKQVALLTDARFSGFSTGACIGHVSPEALSGGPIGKLRSGDLIEIVIDRKNLVGTVNLVGENGVCKNADFGSQLLSERPLNPNLRPDRDLPPETRLWAALQDVSGGTWGGCVFDVDSILKVLAAGKRILAEDPEPN